MYNETVKVKIGQEEVEFYKDLLHGTACEIQEVYRPYLSNPNARAILQLTDPDEIINKLHELVAGSADITKATDIMIVGQVKSWTFGEVSFDTLNHLPESIRESLAQEVNKLYSQLPLSRLDKKRLPFRLIKRFASLPVSLCRRVWMRR